MREGDARRDAHLVEDIAQVRLDRLAAEEQLLGDLGVGLAVDDEVCNLEFAFGQRRNARSSGLPGLRAPVWAMAELSQLSLRALAVSQRAAGVERRRCALQFGHGAVLLAGLGKRSAREYP